ncbi:MAG: glycosyltransferase [Bacillota bacterium]|nr:glycosyltransferase [Bacillota bacterium]
MNILILTGSFGNGHNAAANALAETIGSELKGSHIYVEDLFTHAFNSTKYEYLFRVMVEKGKYFYNMVYRRTEDSDLERKIPFHKYLTRSLDQLIKKTDADIIISTLWSCSKVVSEYKQAKKCNIPLITCITDVSSHNGWLYPYTDFYMAAAPKIKDELIEKGVDPKCIIVSGVPVRSEFKTESINKTASNEKRLLIMGGGLGLLPKSKAFYEELNNLIGVKTTIITGNNKQLYDLLKGKYENIEVLAFVHNVSHYMKNADLLISKPGGITLFETISAELPLLMFKPFLEQEMRNGEFVMDNNLGDVLSTDPQEWIARIQQMLWNDELLDTISANMHNFKSLLDYSGLFHLLQQYERQIA